ncbi:hypothetical protein AMTR_s00041p00219380 [Amborella trichopoda]|uniref:Uncharacterized protein n=1 Tax=Amborella trichopoda TaxID=13333 RepID=W1PYS9_AMBTC|nr:hypothetical protein AMTR_s00041p00219380 [Amborella trichopoda]
MAGQFVGPYQMRYCVLDEIVGFDWRDKKATGAASKFIPVGGYNQFLKAKGLKGKRLGKLFLDFPKNSVEAQTFEAHFQTLRYSSN